MARSPRCRAFAAPLLAAVLAAALVAAAAEDPPAEGAPADAAAPAAPAPAGDGAPAEAAPPADAAAPADPAAAPADGEAPAGDAAPPADAAPADAPPGETEREKELLASLGEDRGMEARLAAYKSLIEIKSKAVSDAIGGRDEARRDADNSKRRSTELTEQLTVVRAAADEFKRGMEIKKADAERCLASDKEMKEQLQQARKDLDIIRDQLRNRQVEAEDPTFSRWIQRRVQGVGALFTDEHSGRLLGEAVGGAIDGARDRVALLESEVETRAGAPPLVAGLLCTLAVTLPLYFLYVSVPRITKAISFRQHMLIGHVFNMTVLATALGSALSSGVDPLVTISRTPTLRVLLCTVFLIQWVVMFTFILHSALHSSTLRDQRACFLHFVGFALLCVHCKNRTYPNLVRAASGEIWLYANMRYYAGYIIALGGLVVLTVSSAQSDKPEGIVTDISSIIEGGVGGLQSEVMSMMGPGKDSGRRFSARSLPRTPPAQSSSALPVSLGDAEKLS